MTSHSWCVPALLAAVLGLTVACSTAPADDGRDFEAVDPADKDEKKRASAEDEADYDYSSSSSNDDLEPSPTPASTPDRQPGDTIPPAPACTSSCSTKGSRRCVDGKNEYETCTEIAGGCMAWQLPTTCGAGNECTGAGTCSSLTNKAAGAPCTDDGQCASNRCNSCPYYAGRCCVP